MGRLQHATLSTVAVKSTEGQRQRDSSRTGEKISLSPRELQIARRVARGYTNKEIASELRISTGTVGTYMTRIFHKLNIHTRAEMIARLMQAGGLLSTSSEPSPSSDSRH